MIVSARHGFCFVHIPKTGGVTIRRQIMDMHDQVPLFDAMPLNVPEGGFRMAHLPAAVLKQQFPAVFDMIRKLRSYAVVRDPEARLYTAFAQHLKAWHGKFESDLSDKELKQMLAAVRDHLAATKPYPKISYTHFLRQTDFTHLKGQPFVDDVVPIEQLARLASNLSARTGKQIDASMRLNETVSFKYKGAKTPLIAAKNRVKSCFPFPHIHSFVAQRCPSSPTGTLANALHRSRASWICMDSFQSTTLTTISFTGRLWTQRTPALRPAMRARAMLRTSPVQISSGNRCRGRAPTRSDESSGPIDREPRSLPIENGCRGGTAIIVAPAEATR